MTITPVGFGAWAIGGPDWAVGWGAQDDHKSVAAIRLGCEDETGTIGAHRGHGTDSHSGLVGQ